MPGKKYRSAGRSYNREAPLLSRPGLSQDLRDYRKEQAELANKVDIKRRQAVTRRRHTIFGDAQAEQGDAGDSGPAPMDLDLLESADSYTFDFGTEGVECQDDGHDADVQRETIRRIRGEEEVYTRGTWMHAQAREWAALMPELELAYLRWKHAATNNAVREASAELPAYDAVDGSNSHQQEIEIQVVGLDGFYVQTFSIPSNRERAVSLVHQGILVGVVWNPKYGFPFSTLHAYYVQKTRMPGTSIEGFARSLCQMYNIFAKHEDAIQDNFSRAFDQYVAILRMVDRRVQKALGRGENWRVVNGCPACAYKQDGEPPLCPARLHATDGGGSFKRRKGVGRNDERAFESDFFIPVEEVNRFKDEVHHRANKRSAADEGPPPCVDNWKTARATEASATTLGEYFDETGLVISVCRHGIPEYAVRMVQSGELAKYVLAIANRVLDDFQHEPHQWYGYDVGCSTQGTLMRSSLGTRAREFSLQFVVNAFHGYQHERKCQLRNHPLYKKGIGLEDLETCERFFSVANGVAHSIHHASSYYWEQAIHLQLMQIAEDRYRDLGNFVLHKYKTTHKLIESYTLELDDFFCRTSYTASDLERWPLEELDWLESRQQEPEFDARRVSYVEALIKAKNKRNFYEECKLRAVQHFTSPLTAESFASSSSAPNVQTSVSRAAARERTLAQEAWSRAEEHAALCERELGLEEPWLPNSPEYRETVAYLEQREFTLAARAAQAQLVSRWSELAKANLLDTGYKMRKEISASITKRSETTQRAIERFNAAALKQRPPVGPIDWKDIGTHLWRGDFDLFKVWDPSLLDKPWLQPANRDAISKHFKLLRAQEELTRLEVEAWRLYCWVDYDDQLLTNRATELSQEDPLTSACIAEFAIRRQVLNNRIRDRLHSLFKLSYYAGQQGKSQAQKNINISTPSSTSRQTVGSDCDEENEPLHFTDHEAQEHQGSSLNDATDADAMADWLAGLDLID